MANYLGFQPTASSKYYFISYSAEDAAKVGPIAYLLSQKLSLWYDYGLNFGEGWGRDIADHIENAEAMLLFLSKSVFAREQNSYVYTEYQMAKDFFQKPIIIIHIESITKSDISSDLLDWWNEISHCQSIIRHSSMTDEFLADQIYKAVINDEEVHYEIPKETPEKQTIDIPIVSDPLLKRAFICLEDCEWQDADEYCEMVLSRDPENAEAYLGKLMAEQHVCRQKDLKNCKQPFDHSSNYKKTVRFGDERLVSELKEDIAYIIDRNERRIAAVLATLKAGLTGEREKTVEERLLESREKIRSLTSLLSELNKLLVQDTMLQKEKREIAVQEAELFKRRMNLGIFDGNEKRQIDAKRAILSNEKQDLIDRINLNEQQRRGYTSKAEIEKDIAKEKTSANDLETQIRNDGDKENFKFSFKEAASIYSQEPDVADAVNKAFPLASICSSTPIFGRYVQRKDGTPEPIEWQVLKQENGRMLLISKYALDCQAFDSKNADIWEDSTLRSWLNHSFLTNAFTDEEQAMIKEEVVIPDKNPQRSMSLRSFLENDTSVVDKVFLLNVSEANQYFHSNEERKCIPTEYAIANGVVNRQTTCQWWLRTIGGFIQGITTIDVDGSINLVGEDDNNKIAVRPAIWVKYGP